MDSSSKRKSLKSQKSETIVEMLNTIPKKNSSAGLVAINTAHSSPVSAGISVGDLNSAGSNNGEFVPLYVLEISQMMRGFGDCESPLRESVILIEKIVVQQMKALINDVVQIAIKRCDRPIPIKKDFEFLMRRNPTKLLRMKRYIKELYNSIYKQNVEDEFDPSNCLPNDEDEEEYRKEKLNEKYDEEKMRRLFRADSISQKLNFNEYEKFSKLRKASFNNLKSKIRQWLNISPDIVLKQIALEIISFLARETVATIVDYCILTRLNSSNRLNDPFCRSSSASASYEALHLCPEVTQSRGLDGVKPITVQEINEAMRRHNWMATKKLRMGMFRNGCIDYKIPYLAL